MQLKRVKECQSVRVSESQSVRVSECPLTVTLPPPLPEPVSRPVLTLVPNGASVSEGQDLTLNCSVQRGTLPVTFTWFSSGRTDPLAFQTLQGNAGTYTIAAVARGHSGGYYCEGSNPALEVKRSFTVVVGSEFSV